MSLLIWHLGTEVDLEVVTWCRLVVLKLQHSSESPGVLIKDCLAYPQSFRFCSPKFVFLICYWVMVMFLVQVAQFENHW